MNEIFSGFENLFESITILKKKFQGIKEEILKKETFYKGEIFEEFVEDVLFPESDYTLIRRTDTYERNQKRFAEITIEPDLEFRCKTTLTEFAVEAKYRSNLNKGNLSWTKTNQLERYKKYNIEKRPLFIVVGLGGTAKKPDQLFLFPVKFMPYKVIFKNVADKYLIDKKMVESSNLWDRFEIKKY